ncbi:MAG: sulfatase, partial [Candidatus Poribacteria bacterium]
IVSDTLRRDHLGCYGNESIKTPNLDRFAQRCAIFDKCYSASFPTMPMRADLFTGKWTFTYLGWAPLPRDEVILSGQLRSNGYTTMAVVDTPFFIKNAYHYDRGFSDFLWIRGQGAERRDVNYERRYEEDYCAPMTMTAAEKWLERHYKEQFFLYVDTWDPHEPWDPPNWYVEQYYPDYDGKVVPPCYWDFKERGVEEEDLKIAHACYCGEVTMVDRWVGRLLERIESLNLMDKTAIIFTTDHGFYFGEHGQFGKARMEKGKWYRSPIYEEINRIPFMVYFPGIQARRIDALVSAVDMMPTILQLCGVEIPEQVQGHSLVPILKEDEEKGRDFVVSSLPLYNPGDVTRAVDAFERNIQEYVPSTITTDEWAFLYSAEGEPAELYNLKSDPKQQHNVIQEHPQVASDLHQKFVSLLEETNTDSRFIAPRRRL